MSHYPAATRLFHITDVSNLPAVLAAGCLLSDVALAGVAHQVIGRSLGMAISSSAA